MDDIVLAEDQKALIANTALNFKRYRRVRKEVGFDDKLKTGLGVIMLFYGESGTGKTMTANAVAALLGKKILLINFPSLGGAQAGENLKFIFREAAIHDAVIFFDECESIFVSREVAKGGDINLLLSEIERHDGMIILATNRPHELDEAMHRRITLATEFPKPDLNQRLDIWKALLPPKLELAPDVDLRALALRYELTGGYIKNALLSALSAVLSKTSATGKVVVSQEDLHAGAQLQLRGRLRMKAFDRRIVPIAGLEAVQAAPAVIEALREIVNFEKAKGLLLRFF